MSYVLTPSFGVDGCDTSFWLVKPCDMILCSAFVLEEAPSLLPGKSDRRAGHTGVPLLILLPELQELSFVEGFDLSFHGQSTPNTSLRDQLMYSQ